MRYEGNPTFVELHSTYEKTGEGRDALTCAAQFALFHQLVLTISVEHFADVLQRIHHENLWMRLAEALGRRTRPGRLD